MEQTLEPVDIKGSIKSFILKEFLPGENPDELTNTTPLVTGGILDSLATVKLASFVENQFAVELAPHELSSEYLDTLDSIAELVLSKRAD